MHIAPIEELINDPDDELLRCAGGGGNAFGLCEQLVVTGERGVLVSTKIDLLTADLDVPRPRAGRKNGLGWWGMRTFGSAGGPKVRWMTQGLVLPERLILATSLTSSLTSAVRAQSIARKS